METLPFHRYCVAMYRKHTEIQNSHLVEGSTSEPTETGAVLAVGVVGTA